MHCPLLIGAAALLTGAAKAAPKAPEDEVLAHLVHGRTFQSEPVPGAWAKPRRGRPGHHHNGTNATTLAATGGAARSTFSLPLNSKRSSVHSVCSLSVVTSTTTVDITLYITATTSYGGNLTSSFHAGSTHPSFTSSRLGSNTTTSHTTRNVSSTLIQLSTGLTRSIDSSVTVSSSAPEAPCSDATISEQLLQNTTTPVSYTSTTSPLVVHNTSSALPSQSTDPCDDTSSASRSDSSTTAVASSKPLNSTTAWSKHTSMTGIQTAAPCDDETSTATGSSEQYAYTSDATTNQTSSYATPSGSSPVSSSATSSSSGKSIAISPSASATNITSTYLSAGSTKATEPCEEESGSATSATASNVSSAPSQTFSASIPGETRLSIPRSSTQAAILMSTSTEFLASSLTQTTSATATRVPSESCIIDTSMVPVTSAPLTLVPSSTLVPTKTVCRDDAPTGKPLPENQHCGVHGLPVGNYFLARFVENSPGVPVTLEGCYQFCASVMNATDGCKSYRFYAERGLDVPRCDLFGSSVAYALDSIDNDHPDLWFDLTCGSPSDALWSHLTGMT